MTVSILTREEENGKVPRLSLNEQAVLGALLLRAATAPDLARLFAPGGPFHPLRRLGKVQVYRALGRLLQLKLVQEEGARPSPSGPPAALYALTPEGRLWAEAWLRTPLSRLPEARVLLRLKLALHLLLGQDPKPFLLAQKEAYQALLQRLKQEAEGAKGLGRVYALWWREMAAAGLCYVEALLEEGF